MKKYFFLSVALTMTLLFFSEPSIAISIEILPSSTSGSVSSSTDIELFISGLGIGGAPSVGEFDLDVTFDPAVIGFSSASFGDPILGDQLDVFGLGSITSATPGADFVNLFELSFDSASDLNDWQADSFTLATLTFDLLSTGTSPLGLSLWSLADADAENLSADLFGGSIDVNAAPVPEPATLILLFSGMAGLGVFGRKRIRK
jgi:hypothetical protein